MREKAPFPYFGGKAAVADVVWKALGQPKHYIEPFFGSGAVLLNRPDFDQTKHIETINDKDGYVANVWRALQADPDAVAKICDWPVNYADLSARKRYLLANAGLLDRLTTDDQYYDVKMAGYWIWAASCWIGTGLTFLGQRPHISDGGKGVHAIGQRPQISDDTADVQSPYNTNIYLWFRRLAERLRYVRVVCGDWTRVCGGNWQDKLGTAGIFCDPPYGHDAGRDNDIYHVETDCAAQVREWCIARGDKPTYRIVLAGYDGEHNVLEEEYGWRVYEWKAQGGYSWLGSDDNQNRNRERLWFSPHCLGEYKLFD